MTFISDVSIGVFRDITNYCSDSIQVNKHNNVMITHMLIHTHQQVFYLTARSVFGQMQFVFKSRVMHMSV